MNWNALNKINRFFEYKTGNATFIAKQKVLAHLAQDLIAGLSPELRFDQPSLVFCGIHNSYHIHHWRRGYKLGIQTEQFLNQQGDRLWRYESFLPKVIKQLDKFDKIIDINSSNKPVYDHLPLSVRQKIVLGPHIFPTAPPNATKSKLPFAAFVGDYSGRRAAILAELEAKQHTKVIKTEVYGEELLNVLGPYSAVLNVHYDKGTYTESPRLLMALNAGKAVVSEPLSSEFTEGVHYLGLDQPPSEADFTGIYENFSSHVCNNFSFQSQLLALGLASIPCADSPQSTG